MDAVVLCAAFFLGIGLLQSVFYVEGRHRWSVESALIVLAAAGTVSLWASRRAAASSR
jgi:high-affinity Fe2+/Pb2+ permease